MKLFKKIFTLLIFAIIVSCNNQDKQVNSRLDKIESEMKSQIDSLKNQLQEMINQLQKNPGGSSSGSDQLGKLISQQEKFEKMLNQYLSGDNVGLEQSKKINEIKKLLEDNKRDILNRKINQNLLLFITVFQLMNIFLKNLELLENLK